MYVAVGAPYDLFYTGNEYFYYNGGRWCRGPFYNGLGLCAGGMTLSPGKTPPLGVGTGWGWGKFGAIGKSSQRGHCK